MFCIARSIAATVDLLLPPTCLLCSAILTAQQGQHFLCCDCLEDIQPINSGCCRRCAQPYPAAEAHHLCKTCLQNPVTYSSVYTVGKYTGSIKSAVQQLKYRQQLALAKPLGELLATSTLQHLRDFTPDCVIPVPLHARRLRSRGYNQALEIARPLAKKLRIPSYATYLHRVRDTPQQQGLSAAERRKNLRHAFALFAPLPARKVLLVDDVMTTGETVRECSRVLLDSGIDEVRVAVAGRA